MPNTFQTINAGVSGDSTAMMLARFQAEVIDASPQVGVVVIDGGINDWVRESTEGPVSVANVAAMASMAKAAGIKVIIASLMLEPYPPPSVDEINSFNDALVALCASEGYLYADYRDVMLLADGTQDLSLYVDGLHPNAAGYARMWAVILPLIEEYLQ
jgi:acyl-CoA thioesterase I